MRFKDWLQNEDAMASAGEYGNQEDPNDRGLFDPEGSTDRKPVPDSEKADDLFLGKKKRKKKLKNPV